VRAVVGLGGRECKLHHGAPQHGVPFGGGRNRKQSTYNQSHNTDKSQPTVPNFMHFCQTWPLCLFSPRCSGLRFIYLASCITWQLATAQAYSMMLHGAPMTCRGSHGC
jgi:hypothetical protein